MKRQIVIIFLMTLFSHVRTLSLQGEYVGLISVERKQLIKEYSLMRSVLVYVSTSAIDSFFSENYINPRFKKIIYFIQTRLSSLQKNASTKRAFTSTFLQNYGGSSVDYRVPLLSPSIHAVQRDECMQKKHREVLDPPHVLQTHSQNISNEIDVVQSTELKTVQCNKPLSQKISSSTCIYCTESVQDQSPSAYNDDHKQAQPTLQYYGSSILRAVQLADAWYSNTLQQLVLYNDFELKKIDVLHYLEQKQEHLDDVLKKITYAAIQGGLFKPRSYVFLTDCLDQIACDYKGQYAEYEVPKVDYCAELEHIYASFAYEFEELIFLVFGDELLDAIELDALCTDIPQSIYTTIDCNAVIHELGIARKPIDFQGAIIVEPLSLCAQGNVMYDALVTSVDFLGKTQVKALHVQKKRLSKKRASISTGADAVNTVVTEQDTRPMAIHVEHTPYTNVKMINALKKTIGKNIDDVKVLKASISALQKQIDNTIAVINTLKANSDEQVTLMKKQLQVSTQELQKQVDNNLSMISQLKTNSDEYITLIKKQLVTSKKWFKKKVHKSFLNMTNRLKTRSDKQIIAMKKQLEVSTTELQKQIKDNVNTINTLQVSAHELRDKFKRTYESMSSKNLLQVEAKQIRDKAHREKFCVHEEHKKLLALKEHLEKEPPVIFKSKAKAIQSIKAPVKTELSKSIEPAVVYPVNDNVSSITIDVQKSPAANLKAAIEKEQFIQRNKYNLVDEKASSLQVQVKRELDVMLKKLKARPDFGEFGMQTVLELLDLEVEIIDHLLDGDRGIKAENAVETRDKVLRRSPPSVKWVHGRIVDVASTFAIKLTNMRKRVEQEAITLSRALNKEEKKLFLQRMQQVLASYYAIIRNMQHTLL